MGNFSRVCFLPSVSKVYSFEDIKSVPYLVTKASGVTVVYPNVYGVIRGIKGGFHFYPMPLKYIVQKIQC